MGQGKCQANSNQSGPAQIWPSCETDGQRDETIYPPPPSGAGGLNGQGGHL